SNARPVATFVLAYGSAADRGRDDARTSLQRAGLFCRNGGRNVRRTKRPAADRALVPTQPLRSTLPVPSPLRCGKAASRRSARRAPGPHRDPLRHPQRLRHRAAAHPALNDVGPKEEGAPEAIASGSPSFLSPPASRPSSSWAAAPPPAAASPYPPQRPP